MRIVNFQQITGNNLNSLLNDPSRDGSQTSHAARVCDQGLTAGNLSRNLATRLQNWRPAKGQQGWKPVTGLQDWWCVAGG